MTIIRNYTEFSSLKSSEYSLIDDQIKKIITIEAVVNLNNYSNWHLNQSSIWVDDWMNTESGKWLSNRWLELPIIVQMVQMYEHFDYIHKVFVRLYEDDAVYYTLKWK